MATLLEIQETLINSGVSATTVTVDFDALTVDVNLDLRAQIEISGSAGPEGQVVTEDAYHEIAIRSYDETHALDTEIVLGRVHPSYPHLIVAMVKSVLEEESTEIEWENAVDAELDAEMLVLQSRRNANQPWTEVARASSYSRLTSKVHDELERLGFPGYANRLDLVDELDPTGKSDPAADYMTSDEGAQIRVSVR